MEDYFNIEVNERLCKSASETLDRYIQNHDMRRSREMTRSLKYERNPDKLLRSLTKDMSALDEEIFLAKNLFVDESFNLSVHERSLTTEELLLDHSFNRGHFTPSPMRNGDSEHLRYSDLYQQSGSDDRHSTHSQQRRPTSSLSTNDDTNLQCLHQFLHHGRRNERQNRFSHESSTPSRKYTRSQISSKDIKGDLTVSMNYLPQKKITMTKYDDSNDSFEDRQNLEKYGNHEAEILRFQQNRRAKEDEDGLITVLLQLEGKPASVREFMGECFTENSVKKETSNPGQRTIESLKNMLFSLQEISSESQNDLDNRSQDGLHDDDQDAPGCESLEKAMKHLVILKNLVKEVGKSEKKKINH